jgi:hypothetical protein
MGAFGAVTVSISTFVISLSHSHIEYPLGFFDLGADLGEISDL